MVTAIACPGQTIIHDIELYIKQCGGIYRGWYVGIANDARDRLFNGHGVKERSDLWIYRVAQTSDDARTVEKYFLDVRGTDGGPGGGDYDTKSVYAYRKAQHTRE